MKWSISWLFQYRQKNHLTKFNTDSWFKTFSIYGKPTANIHNVEKVESITRQLPTRQCVPPCPPPLWPMLTFLWLPPTSLQLSPLLLSLVLTAEPFPQNIRWTLTQIDAPYLKPWRRRVCSPSGRSKSKGLGNLLIQQIVRKFILRWRWNELIQ